MQQHEARKLLGVKPDANFRQIKQAYRVRSMSTHPDRGGSAKAFGQVQTAYAALKVLVDTQESKFRFLTERFASIFLKTTKRPKSLPGLSTLRPDPQQEVCLSTWCSVKKEPYVVVFARKPSEALYRVHKYRPPFAAGKADGNANDSAWVLKLHTVSFDGFRCPACYVTTRPYVLWCGTCENPYCVGGLDANDYSTCPVCAVRAKRSYRHRQTANVNDYPRTPRLRALRKKNLKSLPAPSSSREVALRKSPQQGQAK